ncbi:hypothetical protein SS50377_22871 [Spironucleus salmonicida]|uniref:Uncharacterized protein n=1 Tax=Spironucleus salmonicida TaxID=348837 RepID=V6LWW8_9EUKA|nr:hypothetical protein SS50377_22871 [Spironucleus salmonicida]|eukprot:EST48723.1 Hypothetical protein SS50377_11039 [Spironucleus salmonicida]
MLSSLEILAMINGPCPPPQEEQAQMLVDQQQHVIGRLKRLVLAQKEQIKLKNDEINSLRHQLGLDPIIFAVPAGSQSARSVALPQPVKANFPGRAQQHAMESENAHSTSHIGRSQLQAPETAADSQFSELLLSNISLFGVPAHVRGLQPVLFERTLEICRAFTRRDYSISLAISSAELTQIMENVPEINCKIDQRDSGLALSDFVPFDVQRALRDVTDAHNPLPSAVEFALNSAADATQGDVSAVFETRVGSAAAFARAVWLILAHCGLKSEIVEGKILISGSRQVIDLAAPAALFSEKFDIFDENSRVLALISDRQKFIITQNFDSASIPENAPYITQNYQFYSILTLQFSAPFVPQKVDLQPEISNFTAFGIPASLRVGKPANFEEVCLQIYRNFTLHPASFLPEISENVGDLRSYLADLQAKTSDWLLLLRRLHPATLAAEMVLNGERLTRSARVFDLQYLLQRAGVLSFAVRETSLLFAGGRGVEGVFELNLAGGDLFAVSAREVQGHFVGRFDAFDALSAAADVEILRTQTRILRRSASAEVLEELAQALAVAGGVRELTVQQFAGYSVYEVVRGALAAGECVRVVERLE